MYRAGLRNAVLRVFVISFDRISNTLRQRFVERHGVDAIFIHRSESKWLFIEPPFDACNRTRTRSPLFHPRTFVSLIYGTTRMFERERSKAVGVAVAE